MIGPPDASALEPVRRALIEARAIGFLGPGDIEGHIRHALGYVAVIEATAAGSDPLVLDLGSGGGVPGLVIAATRPVWQVTLLEGATRRAAWLDDIVQRLTLSGRVRVIADRAEQAARRPDVRSSIDVVVARSFGSPAVTAECAAGFLRQGGLLIVSEPPVDGAERWPAARVAPLGLVPSGVRTTGGGRFQVLVQHRLCPDRFPRRVGLPAKRPLF